MKQETTKKPVYSEADLMVILSQIGAVICRWRLFDDNQWAYDYFSPSSERILGFSPQELIDNPKLWISRIHPQDFEEMISHLFGTLRAGKSTSIEFRFQKSNGDWCWLSDTLVSHRDTEGEGWLITCVEIDISDRKQIETKLAALTQNLEDRVQQRTLELDQSKLKLEAANKELERATRLKDDFLANMSHELRTPLNSIMGVSESLLENIYSPLDEKQAKAISMIHRNGQHLLELINDILDLSKIESNNLHLEFSYTSIQSLCNNCLTFIQSQASKKKIKISTQISDIFMKAWIDERRVRQALINLLSNAVKFTPVGGQITLAAEKSDSSDQIVLSVSDTGIGIHPDHIPFLFKPFFQVESAFSRGYAGTGLGLSLVSRIVSLHHGTMSVTSELGKGSCFQISIPHNSTQPAVGKISGLLPQSPEIKDTLVVPGRSLEKGQLILLVEDHNDMLDLLQDNLSCWGYQIAKADNGLDAIQQVYHARPHLIIMDIQMPQMDGLAVIKALRSDPDFRLTPIIALTALAMRGDRESCLQAGANAYLSKPVSFKALQSVVEELLATCPKLVD